MKFFYQGDCVAGSRSQVVQVVPNCTSRNKFIFCCNKTVHVPVQLDLIWEARVLRIEHLANSC